jgi:nitrite reductase/ring-hydroxylating ferredoxin subunit
MLPVISSVRGQLCGIVVYEKNSAFAFFNECSHYSSNSGYTLFPSQGSQYIAHKSSFHGGSHNHFYDSQGECCFLSMP